MAAQALSPLRAPTTGVTDLAVWFGGCCDGKPASRASRSIVSVLTLRAAAVAERLYSVRAESLTLDHVVARLTAYSKAVRHRAPWAFGSLSSPALVHIT